MARTTISMDDKVFDEGVKRAAALGYKKFSPYIEYLVRNDLKERPSHVTVREENGDYPAKGKRGGSNAAR